MQLWIKLTNVTGVKQIGSMRSRSFDSQLLAAGPTSGNYMHLSAHRLDYGSSLKFPRQNGFATTGHAQPSHWRPLYQEIEVQLGVKPWSPKAMH
jgi:hypothetical protein